MSVLLPLLDLVEALEERDRNEDDNGLLAVADLNLKRDMMLECRVVQNVLRTQIAKIQHSPGTASWKIFHRVYDSIVICVPSLMPIRLGRNV